LRLDSEIPVISANVFAKNIIKRQGNIKTNGVRFTKTKSIY